VVPVDADAGNLKLDGNEKGQSPDDDSRCAFDMDELEPEATVCRQGLTSSSDSTFHIPGAIFEQLTD
jgi:hypothetical protein